VGKKSGGRWRRILVLCVREGACVTEIKQKHVVWDMSATQSIKHDSDFNEETK